MIEVAAVQRLAEDKIKLIDQLQKDLETYIADCNYVDALNRLKASFIGANCDEIITGKVEDYMIDGELSLDQVKKYCQRAKRACKQRHSKILSQLVQERRRRLAREKVRVEQDMDRSWMRFVLLKQRGKQHDKRLNSEIRSVISR